MDQKTTDGNSFGNKYLTSTGLEYFLEKLKDYIKDQIKLIYGTNICISNDDETNIKAYIDDKTIFGENKKPIKEVLEDIIGGYVKSIAGVDASDDENINKYFKVSIRQKEIIDKETNETTTLPGEYEIYLEDNGFKDFIEQGVVSKLNVKYESDTQLDQPITDRSNNEYVNLSIDNHQGSIELTLDESGLVEKIGDINAYKVNDKSFIDETNDTKGSIVLDASDILMGDVGDSVETGITGDTNVQKAITDLATKISVLGKPLKIKNVFQGTLGGNIANGNIKDGTFVDGDVIIVGQKEYIYWKDSGAGEEVIIDDHGNKIQTDWILLGDVTQIMEQLETFYGEYTSHIHPITLTMNSTEDGGGIECDFKGSEDCFTEVVDGYENVEEGNEIVDIEEVSYISADTVVTKLPTFTTVELPTKEHTHETTITPRGTVDSSFTGNPHTHNHNFEGDTSNTEYSGLSITYDDSSCTLSILTSHNHSFTPKGNIEEIIITPTGSVDSVFTGTKETWSSVVTQSIEEFNSVNDD
jgi:hypothetical protein